MRGATPASDSVDVPQGLVYTSDIAPGIRRLRRGKSFSYQRGNGSLVSQESELQRIGRLAIPPAYEQVWICASPRGHLQATGRDARGRKQYRYHPLWRAQRDAWKYERLQAFALALPRIRRRVAQDLRGPDRRKQLLAAVVRLLDTTCGRIGNGSYARENGSYGLTTLRNRHAQVRGDRIELHFQGKSGVVQHLALQDARLARIVRRCQQLPGQTLFSYRDEAGELRSIDSGDVNAYLQAITGDGFSAKDFRTWHGSALALQVLACALHAGSPCTLKQMLSTVAQALGNTPAVCRKSYVHPRVLEFAQGAGDDVQQAARQLARLQARCRGGTGRGLRAQERALLAFLTH